MITCGLGFVAPSTVRDRLTTLNDAYLSLDHDIKVAPQDTTPPALWQDWNTKLALWASYYQDHHEDGDAYLAIRGDDVAAKLEEFRRVLISQRTAFESVSHRRASDTSKLDQPLAMYDKPIATVGIDQQTKDTLERAGEKADAISGALKFMGFAVLATGVIVGGVLLFRKKEP